MKKIFWGTILMATTLTFPMATVAGIDIRIGIPAPPHIRISLPLPPPIQFSAPPRLVVLPETYVYVAPDTDEEIYFYDGWWWRPWEGGWYRSRAHDSGWQRYKNVPSFYRNVPGDWRNDYREGQWRGHQWNVAPLPHRQVQQNWNQWKKTKHWEKQQTWGVQELRRQPKSQKLSREVQPGRSGQNNGHGRSQQLPRKQRGSGQQVQQVEDRGNDNRGGNSRHGQP
jgi:hypothetical protein